MGGLGQHAESAAQSLGNARAESADLGERIGTARDRFWESYPEGSDAVEAARDFDRALLAKDMYYVMIAAVNETVARGSSRPGPGASAASLLDAVRLREALFGRVDGGTPGAARVEFAEWLEVLIRVLSWEADGNTMTVDGAAIRAALSASQPQYARYRLVRDVAEVRSAGVALPGSAREYAVGAVVESWERTDRDRAGQEHDEAAEVLGADAVESVVERVRAAPEDERGFLTDLAPLGLFARTRADDPEVVPDGLAYSPSRSVADVVKSLLVNGSDRTYALGVFTLGGSSLGNWRGSEILFGNLVDTYGEETVMSAARRLRAAPRGTRGLRRRPGHARLARRAHRRRRPSPPPDALVRALIQSAPTCEEAPRQRHPCCVLGPGLECHASERRHERPDPAEGALARSL